jgi:hypothetical protein
MEDFKIIVIPSYLNPGAPEGENLVLVFTIAELEVARKRGETIIHNRMAKGMSRDEAVRSCAKLS